MPSQHKIGQYLEWYTDIPLQGDCRETPVFFLKGNEWFFRAVLNLRYSDVFDLEIYLELKNKYTDLESCLVKCQIGFKNEETLSLHKTQFEVSEHHEVWSIPLSHLQKELPYNYMVGNWLKFVFFFDGVTEPLLKIGKYTGNTSSELQLLDSNFSLENLSQDFGNMLLDGTDHDVELKCDGQTWKAHKNVLSIRSRVLQAMLNSDMVEGRTGVITLQDMDVPTVQHFLSYLYSGKLPEMTVETAKQLYEVGDKYAVESLKKICSSYLVDNLTPQNACEALIVAVQHSDSNFKEYVIQFIIEKRVFMDDFWQDFRQSNPMIAFEVYDRFCKAECSK